MWYVHTKRRIVNVVLTIREFSICQWIFWLLDIFLWYIVADRITVVQLCVIFMHFRVCCANQHNIYLSSKITTRTVQVLMKQVFMTSSFPISAYVQLLCQLQNIYLFWKFTMNKFDVREKTPWELLPIFIQKLWQDDL